MGFIKRRWQSAVVLSLAVGAIAVPALASSGGGGGVRAASDRSDPGIAGVAFAGRPAASDEAIQVKSPAGRQQFDDAIQCMTDKGFGHPTDDGGVSIGRAETDSDSFKQAAKDCGLPPPPTDAEIRQLPPIKQLGCAPAPVRRDRNGG
jgi:hypothetical protein